MRRLLLAIIFCFSPIACPRTFGMEPASDPNLAVVRIKSHGCSGTVIQTTDGKSYILSCAHMFFDAANNFDPKKINATFDVDGARQPYAPKKTARVKVLGADSDADLSLLEMDNGPFYYIPIAPKGHRPGRYILSAGYDDMKWPITNQWCTLLGADTLWLYTREKPWHGRSGGGLFDYEAKVLIGVISAYENPPGSRGIYANHESILRFMAKFTSRMEQTPRTPPTPPRSQKFTLKEEPCLTYSSLCLTTSLPSFGSRPLRGTLTNSLSSGTATATSASAAARARPTFALVVSSIVPNAAPIIITLTIVLAVLLWDLMRSMRS